MVRDITFGAVQKKIDTALDKHEYDTAKIKSGIFCTNFLSTILL